MTIEKKRKKPLEIALVGDVDAWEHDVIKDLLELRPRRECTFYIDSLGGSVYGALAVTTLIRMRTQLHRHRSGRMLVGVVACVRGLQEAVGNAL